MDNHIETRVGEPSVDGALFFYFNETTGDLVYSDKATYSGNGYTSLGRQTNMNPSSPSIWVFNSQRSSIVTVSKDESIAGKIAGLTSMNGMFSSCKNLTSLDLSSLDTSAVVNMDSMFAGCSNLTGLNLSSFDTSSVTSMYNMFFRCGSLTGLDLSGFNTSAVTNMSYMFGDCTNLTRLDLSSFDTSDVIRMDSMFYGCNSLASLDLSSFDTSAVQNMTSMFENCSSLTSLDLSSFDTSVGPRMDSTFKNCDNLISLDLSSFDTSALTDMVNDTYDMFDGCISLRIIDISPNMSNVLNRLPADTYYDAVTRQPYAKAGIPGGSTYVRDLDDLDLVATMVQTRMGINKVKGMLNEVRDLKKQVDASLQQIQSLQDSLSRTELASTLAKIGFYSWNIGDDVALEILATRKDGRAVNVQFIPGRDVAITNR